MAKSHILIHIIEIVGAVLCAHHFWPKGVTYGEQEEWEKKHRSRKHRHGSSSKEKRGRGRTSSEGSRGDRRDEGRRYRVRSEEVKERGYRDREVPARRASLRY